MPVITSARAPVAELAAARPETLFFETTVPAAVPETSRPQTRLLLAVGADVLVLRMPEIVFPRIVCTPVAETSSPVVCVEKDESGTLAFVTFEIVLLATVWVPPVPSTDMPQ